MNILKCLRKNEEIFPIYGVFERKLYVNCYTYTNFQIDCDDSRSQSGVSSIMWDINCDTLVVFWVCQSLNHRPSEWNFVPQPLDSCCKGGLQLYIIIEIFLTLWNITQVSRNIIYVFLNHVEKLSRQNLGYLDYVSDGDTYHNPK